ncbi:MAG: TCP-1/cpn60 chaperonin family protein, partial [Polyangiaceae bacterium]
RALDELKLSEEQAAGVRIIRRAIEEPLRQIVANAGGEGSIVVHKVKEGSGNFGYNAATGEYGDLVAQGVIDPVKVVRSALQNAASVAGLLLTTESIVVEKPKEEKAAAGAHAHGGAPDF